MPIKIKPTETRVKESDGTKIYYIIPNSFNRIEVLNDSVILEKDSNLRGDIDRKKYIISILEKAITGWDNLENEKGEQVLFNKDLIKYLPVDILMDIFIDIENYYYNVEKQKKT